VISNLCQIGMASPTQGRCTRIRQPRAAYPPPDASSSKLLLLAGGRAAASEVVGHSGRPLLLMERGSLGGRGAMCGYRCQVWEEPS